ncbi:hypothetical protein M378DRAFT_801884 [Amanita muscaria Koide BX008]|uniref:Uncharacterized protein n=1 Tax=Amanita muscaria (strain Koide BX008) TaxID=946122 RepID=A0A0C2SGD7_AMAMK|nr:hypothetical protein M378DRAFT_801884 [Amanita muscaria Koide BX008]
MFFISKLVFQSFASVAGLLPLLSHILLFPPTLLAKEYHNEADGTPTITWKRPTSGATFQPGDTLAVEWISDSDIVSPSIRLCGGSTDTRRRRSLGEANKRHHRQIRRENNCGESIWPEVQKTSNGSQRVDLDLPNAAEPKSYYLVMQDNFGSLMQSPLFSVSSGQVSSSDATSTNAVADTITSTSKTTPYTDDSGPTNLPAAQAPLSHPSAVGPVHGVPPSFNSTEKSTPGIPKGPIYVDSNNLLTHNHPTPVAAFAIPLTAAAVALLIAGGLAIRHCRARRKEREDDKLTSKILDKLRRSGTRNSSSSTQSTNAPQIPPMQIQPIPLFMPMSMPISMEHDSISATQQASTLDYPKIGEARQSTRRAYCYQSPLGPSASNGYSYSLSNDMSCAHLRGIPTHASSSRSRSRNLPAMKPYTSSSPLSAPYLPPPSFSRGMAKERSSISNSCTTSDILEDYCLPSPHLGSVSHDTLGQGLNLPLNSSPIKPPPLPPSLLPAPQMLHIRDEAPTGAPILPSATHESEHERLPSRMPTPAGSLYREQRDAYAAIASLLNKP